MELLSMESFHQHLQWPHTHEPEGCDMYMQPTAWPEAWGILLCQGGGSLGCILVSNTPQATTTPAHRFTGPHGPGEAYVRLDRHHIDILRHL